MQEGDVGGIKGSAEVEFRCAVRLVALRGRVLIVDRGGGQSAHHLILYLILVVHRSLLLLAFKQWLLLECPVHSHLLLVELLAVHFSDGSLRLIEAGVLDQSVSLSIACLSVHIQVETLYLSVLREGIEHIVFLYLLMQVTSDKYPPFHR